MSATADRLRTFACAVLAHRGAVVEWPDQQASGEAVLTSDLARRLGCPEFARMTTGSAEGDLRLDLAGDAIEHLQALSLEGAWTTAARLADRPPKKLDASALVDSTVDIANARVRLAAASPARVEYHCWHMGVQITGEEPWEDLVPVYHQCQHPANGRPYPRRPHGHATLAAAGRRSRYNGECHRSCPTMY